MNDERPTTQFHVNSRGQRLAYEYLRGKSPMVVFLSGYASDMTGSKAEHLAHQCQTWGQAFLRLDYSGHGQSEGRFVDGTIGEWAADATEVITHVSRDPCLLVGSSMGGWIMLLVALTIPERVAGLVGIASAPDFTRDLMWNGLNDEQRATLLRDGEVYLPSDYVDDPFPITRKLIDDGNQRLLLDDAINLKCPVRLIHGLRDIDVPWETSMRLAEQLESHDVSTTLIKDGEHRLSRPGDLATIVAIIKTLLGPR